MLFARSTGATAFILESLSLKFSRQVIVLKYIERNHKHRQSLAEQFQVFVHQKKAGFQNFENEQIQNCRNNIMGIEGSISKNYWKQLSTLLPEKYQFNARTRRPARDIFNAAINYGYGMTYAIIEQAVFSVGLDPYIGFLHVENYKKTALVFDLIEPFRPYIDQLIHTLFQANELNEKHFAYKDNGYYLNKEGKKILIPAFRQLVESRTTFNDETSTFRNHTMLYCNELLRLIKKIKI